MATAAPVLDLSTLIPERSSIRIDGVTYHLKSPDELTLFESQLFSRWGKDMEALGKDPDQTSELEALLAKVAKRALADVPDDVFARLRPAHHLQISEVFTLLLLGHRARRAGAVVGAGPRTGQNSSHAFSTPSVATPAGGSTPPPPHSSGPM